VRLGQLLLQRLNLLAGLAHRKIGLLGVVIDLIAVIAAHHDREPPPWCLPGDVTRQVVDAGFHWPNPPSPAKAGKPQSIVPVCAPGWHAAIRPALRLRGTTTGRRCPGRLVSGRPGAARAGGLAGRIASR